MKNKTFSYDIKNTALHAAIAAVLLAGLMLILTMHVSADTGAYGTGKVDAENGAYLRKSATTFSGKVDVLEYNTDVTIYKEVFKSRTSTDAGHVWLYVKAGDKSGYIRSDLVRDVKYNSVQGYIKNRANYRTGAGIMMDKIGQFKKNTGITICLEAAPVKGTEGSNELWYKISKDGKYYYLCSRNAKIGAVPAKAAKAAPAAEKKAEAAKAAPAAQTPAPAPAAPAQTQPAAEETVADAVPAVSAESAAAFAQVKSALAAAKAVKGTVTPDTITVLKSASINGEVMVELNQNAAVTVKEAKTTQEKDEDGETVAMNWYLVEFDKSQVIVIGDPEAETQTSRPAYMAENQDSDKELEALNTKAEQDLLAGEEDPDDGLEDGDEGSYTGTAADSLADANGIVRGYVTAEDIAAIIG